DRRARLLVSVSVCLAVSLRGALGRLLGDGEVGGVVGDVVVSYPPRRSSHLTDRVGAARHGLPCRAAVGGAHTVGSQEATERASRQWVSVGVDVSLAWRVQRDRGLRLGDGEGGGVVGDVVVA